MTRATKRVFAILILLVLFLSLTFYHSTLDYYFFQDDFFEINISRAHNLQQYLEFFKFREDIIAYRPISLQNYFFISSNLFDMNPVGFRLITFILFFLSFFLIVKVIGKITKNVQVGMLTATFWVLSSIHFMALSWIAAAYNIIGTFFWLLTSFFFLVFVKNFLGPQSRVHREMRTASFAYFFSLIFYLITVGSFEFSITWPVIFGFYFFLVLQNPPAKTIKIFLPFILISVIYIVLRLLLIRVPQIPEYQVTFNTESIKAFFWYILWAFNVPEELKKQVVTNLIFLNHIFLAEFWPLVFKTFTGVLWIITLGVFIPLAKIIKDKIHLNLRLIIFSIVWFTAGISPVLLLPNHTFTMYLTLSAIGLYLALAYLITLTKKLVLTVSILVIWIATSITTVSFYRVNSWMIETQRFAGEFAQNIKQQFPTLPKESVILYHVPYSWQRQALLDQSAIRAIYNDLTLSIYYNKEALLNDYNNIKNRPIYIYLPQ